MPFFAFLFLFLIVPAISVFISAVDTTKGYSLSAMSEAMDGQNRSAFWFSVRFSAGSALVGVVFGTLLAYAAATATRPRWLRNGVTSFSGVAANMGGLPLAFMFLALLGRQGLLTKILLAGGFDLYGGDFELGSVPGLITVYSYFNIPLMVLITLPAIDGLKPAWREACANLGGTSFTYWWRIGLPVLAPSLLGGFLLLFANSFSAYATAAVLTDNSMIVSRRIGFFLGGDVSIGENAVGFSLAAWMIIIMAVSMGLYWVARRRAERWQS
ncbi:MAG: ABC transporter permease subunit [Actinomycetota bacterium]|nr:ABC transporter permease subunit [Actinomycetota bacterium]